MPFITDLERFARGIVPARKLWGVKIKSPSTLDAFQWQPQPAAAAWLNQQLAKFLILLPEGADFADKLRTETGTRLEDWIDHLVLPAATINREELRAVGFVPDHRIYRHPGAFLPPVILAEGGPTRIAVKVESLAAFALAQGVSPRLDGAPCAVYRRAKIWFNERAELWAVERNGFAGFATPYQVSTDAEVRLHHAETLLLRRREFENDEAAFKHLEKLLDASLSDLGVDFTCALFFAAERAYWQKRNSAARLQKARQDKWGLGWGNHDHHTYRSSRRHFARLIALFEKLGCVCRERFYAGKEAGWGAQVLEQTRAGVVVFADVDLARDEVALDFAHESLPPRPKLGTIGLWCALHGEAILQAGMHHLECRFAFDEARQQLRNAGIEALAPFTEFPHLKQAFTPAEIWPVREENLQVLIENKQLAKAQAAKFRRHGAPGSHLEILERNDGFKGFNQQGVSDIIQRTDPRL